MSPFSILTATSRQAGLQEACVSLWETFAVHSITPISTTDIIPRTIPILIHKTREWLQTTKLLSIFIFGPREFPMLPPLSIDCSRKKMIVLTILSLPPWTTTYSTLQALQMKQTGLLHMNNLKTLLSEDAALLESGHANLTRAAELQRKIDRVKCKCFFVSLQYGELTFIQCL